ncbi:MAG TPA: ABC transporter ATP-binding protein [Stellaceae bacterium]|nr:ABC transporter ATP-binding protein [Stellaceae bacterium]
MLGLGDDRSKTGPALSAAMDDRPAAPDAAPLLEITDLALSFGGMRALDGVTCRVAPGRITGLIGPNGAGKSTLFNVVSGLYPADRGAILFDGLPITGNAPETIAARGLARTFQIARGFPKLTVFEHLMLYGQNQPGERPWTALLGNRAARDREAALAEDALAIAARLNLSRVIDNPVTALSGGQKKLLEIGRALMAKPKLILLDEPTAGVNPTLGREIGEHLRGLAASGITLLFVEHDMALIEEISDWIIVMAAGRMLTEGRFDAVRENRDVQDAYLGGAG